MPKLYLFQIEKKSIELARQYSEQILSEIREHYPVCIYRDDLGFVNISSSINGTQIVQFKPALSFVLQINDSLKISKDDKDLVSIVTECLNNKGVKSKSHFEFSF